jgi:undecaprenyl-diphosphatase
MTSLTPESGWLRRFNARVQIAIRQIRRPSRGGVRRVAWRSVVTVGACFLLIFFVTMAMFDVRAITAARELPPGFIAATRVFTDLGKVGWFLIPFPALMILLCFTPARVPRQVQATFAAIFARAAFVSLAIAVPYGFNAIIKQLIGRARPFVGGSANAYLYDPFNWTPAYASLPSNHATTVCAAAVAIGAVFPRARAAMWIYALLIMVSRVIVIAHHPSDVLAGALVGTVGALIVRNYFASRRIVFGVTPDGSVEPFASPSWRRMKSAMCAAFRRA